MRNERPQRPDASPIAGFFADYRERHQFEDFFKKYRGIVAPTGRERHQNFLIGSRLVGEWEERWCRVLRWLLDPRTCSDMARRFQRCFCKQWTKAKLLPDEILAAAREVRVGDSRLDITLQSERNHIVIEAKVWAPYDEGQHRAIDEAIKDGFIVYITRKPCSTTGWKPTWRNGTWRQVADVLEECLDASEPTDRIEERRWRIIACDFIDLVRDEDHV